MPQPSWIHQCGVLHGPTQTADLICLLCGREGRLTGWRLGLHEAMARYQFVHGLSPVGPHRPMADQLFEGTRAPCASCDGEGIRTLSTEQWAACAACEGTGGVWIVPDAEVEARRRQVLERFPNAAASRHIRFLDAILAQDLATGAMIDVSDAGRPWSDSTKGEDDTPTEGPQPKEGAAGTGGAGPDRAGTYLVYARMEESLVFIEHALALDLANLYRAIGTASTWGEFRRLVPRHRYEEVLDLCWSEDDGPESRPQDEDPFPGRELSLVAEGDYPEWPAQLMLEWMPEDILEAPYATVTASWLNGPFLMLDPDHEPEILEALHAAGFRTTLAQALVEAASGYASPAVEE